MSIAWNEEESKEVETLEFSSNPTINHKIKLVVAGLQKGVQKLFLECDKDPDQSWISTQRTLGLPLLKFFKWLAYPKLTPKERSRSILAINQKKTERSSFKSMQLDLQQPQMILKKLKQSLQKRRHC